MLGSDVIPGLAARVAGLNGGRLLVAVDGPDGSGKTVLADRLAEAIEPHRAAIRVSADDFHNVREVRYRRGRHSPEGFWLDSYDYPRLIGDALQPLSRSGDGRYRTASHDLESDQALDPDWSLAPPDSVTVVDGLFLHRDELAGLWDYSIYLAVPLAITAQRMARRNGTSPDPLHPSMRRYVEANRIYRRTSSPESRASLVIDNSDYNKPRPRTATPPDI